MAIIKSQMQKDIEKAYKGAEESQKDINRCVNYLDYHLLALHKAKEANNDEQIAFHVYKVEVLRKKLMELEYYDMPELLEDTEVSG